MAGHLDDAVMSAEDILVGGAMALLAANGDRLTDPLRSHAQRPWHGMTNPLPNTRHYLRLRRVSVALGVLAGSVSC